MDYICYVLRQKDVQQANLRKVKSCTDIKSLTSSSEEQDFGKKAKEEVEEDN